MTKGERVQRMYVQLMSIHPHCRGWQRMQEIYEKLLTVYLTFGQAGE